MRDSGSCGAGSNGGEASLPPRKSCRGYSSLRGRSGALPDLLGDERHPLYPAPPIVPRAGVLKLGQSRDRGSEGLGAREARLRTLSRRGSPVRIRPPASETAVSRRRQDGQGERAGSPPVPGSSRSRGGGGAIPRAGRHGPSPPVGSKTLDGPRERNPRVGTPAGATWSGRVSEPGSRRSYASGGRPRAVPIGRPGLPRDSSTGTSSRSPGRLGGLAP